MTEGFGGRLAKPVGRGGRPLLCAAEIDFWVLSAGTAWSARDGPGERSCDTWARSRYRLDESDSASAIRSRGLVPLPLSCSFTRSTCKLRDTSPSPSAFDCVLLAPKMDMPLPDGGDD